MQKVRRHVLAAETESDRRRQADRPDNHSDLRDKNLGTDAQLRQRGKESKDDNNVINDPRKSLPAFDPEIQGHQFYDPPKSIAKNKPTPRTIEARMIMPK